MKLLKRKLACENSMFEAFFDDLEDENGKIIKNFFVAAPRHKIKNMLTGVAILPVLNGKIGLINLYRHPLQELSWEVPRGFIDSGEDESTSAARELEEETGLICDSKNLTFLGYMTPDGGTYAARIALFAARSCKPVENFKPTESGHRKLEFFESKELDAMIAKSEIQDAATLVTYYRYLKTNGDL